MAGEARPHDFLAYVQKLETRVKDLETLVRKANLQGMHARRILERQFMRGEQEGYSSDFTVTVSPLSTGVRPLQFVYTPPVDADWECSINIGIVQKRDAAYHFSYGGLVLSPADVDGDPQALHLVTQHSAVNLFDHRTVKRTFKLAAGVTYTLNSFLGASSGGTWNYFRGRNQLWMEATAYAR